MKWSVRDVARARAGGIHDADGRVGEARTFDHSSIGCRICERAPRRT